MLHAAGYTTVVVLLLLQHSLVPRARLWRQSVADTDKQRYVLAICALLLAPRKVTSLEVTPV